MKTVLLFVVALVVIQLPNEGNAECCHGKGLLWARKCKDCSKATPYCSREGKCNIFGCNCDGGCKTGPCKHHGHGEHPIKPQEPVPYGGGSSGSYDSKPETPYYSESGSSYDSMPQSGYGTDSQVYEEPDEVQVPDETVDTSVQETDNMESAQESENMESVQESENMESVQESENMESGQESENMESVQESENMESVQESENMESGQEIENMESQTEDTQQAYVQEQSKYEREISTPEDLIQAADVNGDGLMDMYEAEKFLIKRGLAPYGNRVKRSLLDYDRNNDNFLSADEIEPFEDK